MVRFGDSDSAGVVHFHNLFRWCHESWEESLDHYGLNVLDIFPSDKTKSLSIALPIVHCEANFFSPISIGDQLVIQLLPFKLSSGSFQVEYKFYKRQVNVAQALIRHKAINVETRRTCDLPKDMSRWLEASTLNS